MNERHHNCRSESKNDNGRRKIDEDRAKYACKFKKNDFYARVNSVT